MEKLIENLYDAVIKENRWQMYIKGLGVTVFIAVVSLVIGTIIGLVVACVKVSAINTKNPFVKIINSIFNVYTTVIRGTPVLIQLLIIFSTIFITSNSILHCVIAFGLNSGAYVSEIIRGGIVSIDPGQTEAGRSLGLSNWQTMRSIVLPQAIKNTIPSLFNEFIVLVKETSVAGYIAVSELTKAADIIKGRMYENTSLFIAALMYLLVTYLLTLLQKSIERRLARSDRR